MRLSGTGKSPVGRAPEIRNCHNGRNGLVGVMQGAASVSDGVWMYQMTDKGLALEITAKGTKSSKDEDLNKP
jgi:hypothetical protein